jgi:hypothetical protein
VLRPVASSTVDDMGEPVAAEPSRETVDGVLFDPGSTSGTAQEMNMRGVVVDAEFHFPKTYTASLRGCSIAYGGHTYRVVGDPRPYMDANTPGPWNRPVQAQEVY